MKSESDTGNTTYVNGIVDFVNMSGGRAQLSINGKLYNIDQLDSVVDENYILKQGLPGIKDKVTLDYDGDNPKDITFDVNLGSGETVADDVAAVINDKMLDTSLVNVKDGKVTIDKSAFKDYQDGTYKVSVVFNDKMLTAVEDKVTLQVKNGAPGTDTGGTTV
jgi:flagellar basal-body rod modification protein FlgD